MSGGMAIFLGMFYVTVRAEDHTLRSARGRWPEVMSRGLGVELVDVAKYVR